MKPGFTMALSGSFPKPFDRLDWVFGNGGDAEEITRTEFVLSNSFSFFGLGSDFLELLALGV